MSTIKSNDAKDNMKSAKKCELWLYCCPECGENWRYQGGRRMQLETYQKYIVAHQGEFFKCSGCGRVYGFTEITNPAMVGL